MGMGGRRAGSENERGCEGAEGCAAVPWNGTARKQRGVEGDKTRPILYYSTIVVYQSHTDRYSVFAIRGNHACRALLAQHQK